MLPSILPPLDCCCWGAGGGAAEAVQGESGEKRQTCHVPPTRWRKRSRGKAWEARLLFGAGGGSSGSVLTRARGGSGARRRRCRRGATGSCKDDGWVRTRALSGEIDRDGASYITRTAVPASATAVGRRRTRRMIRRWSTLEPTRVGRRGRTHQGGRRRLHRDEASLKMGCVLERRGRARYDLNTRRHGGGLLYKCSSFDDKARPSARAVMT